MTDTLRAAGLRERVMRWNKITRDPPGDVWVPRAYVLGLIDEIALLDAPAAADVKHVAHRGNHIGYACGFSGPHCWACNEPWPCRAERARADPDANVWAAIGDPES